MSTELTSLELEEVSLVDLGDDPLAKVAIFKRNPEGEDMENENTEDLEKGYKEEDMESKKMDDMEDDDEEDMMDDAEEKKPARKSWKAEAIAFEEANKVLLEEIETYKAKVAELEAGKVEKTAEEMIEVAGEMVAKSAIPAPVLKQLQEMQKAVEAETLRKRADEVLPNFKGTTDERGKLLKSVGDDEVLLGLLRSADAAFAAMFEEVGKTDAENDLKSPNEKLNDMVKAYQEDKKEKDFYKAYAAVTKTVEGKKLLLETYKN
ncbi:hypothetical protein UFOVP346_56 [uncultured Caudovirales phage]|uniref:Uncharacterized protein n=1 Tax=uncultured Caudovirales phage TaxID=2100421 RepID=A0A6J5M3C8_9CAUD|nr:hypothetical protein UFOVP346_56 [uncultured Caudovirales phage]